MTSVRWIARSLARSRRVECTLLKDPVGRLQHSTLATAPWEISSLNVENFVKFENIYYIILIRVNSMAGRLLD